MRCIVDIFCFIAQRVEIADKVSGVIIGIANKPAIRQGNGADHAVFVQRNGKRLARGRGNACQVVGGVIGQCGGEAVDVCDGRQKAPGIEPAHCAVPARDLVFADVKGLDVRVFFRTEIFGDFACFDAGKGQAVPGRACKAAVPVRREGQDAAVAAPVCDGAVRKLRQGLVIFKAPATPKHGMDACAHGVVGAADGELTAKIGDGGVLCSKIEVACIEIDGFEPEFAMQAAAHQHRVDECLVFVAQIGGIVWLCCFWVADEQRVIFHQQPVHNTVVTGELVVIHAVIVGDLRQRIELFDLVDQEWFTGDGLSCNAVLSGGGGQGVHSIIVKIDERHDCLPVGQTAAVLRGAVREQVLEQRAVGIQELVAQLHAARVIFAFDVQLVFQRRAGRGDAVPERAVEFDFTGTVGGVDGAQVDGGVIQRIVAVHIAHFVPLDLDAGRYVRGQPGVVEQAAQRYIVFRAAHEHEAIVWLNALLPVVDDLGDVHAVVADAAHERTCEFTFPACDEIPMAAETCMCVDFIECTGGIELVHLKGSRSAGEVHIFVEYQFGALDLGVLGQVRKHIVKMQESAVGLPGAVIGIARPVFVGVACRSGTAAVVVIGGSCGEHTCSRLFRVDDAGVKDNGIGTFRCGKPRRISRHGDDPLAVLLFQSNRDGVAHPARRIRHVGSGEMKHGFVAAGLEQVQNAVDHARVQAGRVQKITESAMLRRSVEDDVLFHHQFLRGILHINTGEHLIVPHGVFKRGRVCEITFQRDKTHGSAAQRYTEAVSRRELHRQGKRQIVRGVFIGRHTVFVLHNECVVDGMFLPVFIHICIGDRADDCDIFFARGRTACGSGKVGGRRGKYTRVLRHFHRSAVFFRIGVIFLTQYRRTKLHRRFFRCFFCRSFHRAAADFFGIHFTGACGNTCGFQDRGRRIRRGDGFRGCAAVSGRLRI